MTAFAAPLASAFGRRVALAALCVALASPAAGKDLQLLQLRGVRSDAPAETGAVSAMPVKSAGPAQAAADPARAVPASASGPAGGGFVYVFDQELRAFLTDYCRRIGLKPEIDGSVRGRVSRVKLPLDPPAMLAELSGRYDIEWYLEGDALRVAPRSELTTRVVSLRTVALDDLVAALKASELDVNRYPLRPLKDSDAVIVKGPTSYVARVVAMVETLGRGGNDGVVRVIRFGVERTPEPAKP